MVYEPSKAYDDILAALRSVKWELFKDKVTPIEPDCHTKVNFFPGQRGYTPPAFPVGGVMMVANNFSNLDGWCDYCRDLDFHDTSPTWTRLRNLILPNTGILDNEFWFTNYNLGVMDVPDQQYEFKRPIREGLGFELVFEKCVVAMRPRLIVTLGGYAAKYLKTDYATREESRRRIREVRTIYGCPAISTWHPAARKSMFPDEIFIAEGKRIGDTDRSVRQARGPQFGPL